MTNKTRRHTARFGARYGVSVKKRFEAVEEKQRKLHICPKCGFEKVQRVSTGIFICNKCNTKYAGGAFYPQTLSGSIIAKMVDQRAFTPELSAVIDANVQPIVRPVKNVELSDEEKIDSLMEEKPSKKKKKKTEEVEMENVENNAETPEEA
ncbi:MAG: 50S ribosomal protein L37ae [Candidatus Diapherotrites archaeon]|uniref:Large ribosomal subunit protein eL43 n=1 Tax=Candidatus Iainarchaeum sp. TaxID=3101447 RepID=A0A8T4C8A2_9ARCH|nr:50S ribosomal protein L37ae [Candidatus Diapherotrites archaeon]